MTVSTREADAAFADLICADPQWLDAEFDALIAASFGSRPRSRRPRRPGSRRAPAAHAAALPGSCIRPGRRRVPGHRRAGTSPAALASGAYSPASPGPPPPGPLISGRRPA